MSTNILLTGGRAPVTLDLARLLSVAGYKVFVADSIKHHLCTASRAVIKNFLVPPPRLDPKGYIDALLKIIQQEKIGFLIPTCEEIFYISNQISQLTPYCQVFSEQLEKLNRLHNKWQFINRVQQLGLTAPQTWIVNSHKDLLDILDLPIPNNIVLKPVYSRFASHVHILSKPVSKIPSLEINSNKAWVAQEFISGKHYCTYSIAHQGKVVAHAVYPTLFTAGKGSCIYFESIEHGRLLEWVKTFVEAEEFTGQIAFDFIEADDGTLYPLECNPRAISAIHLFEASDGLERAFFNNTNIIIQPKVGQRSAIAMAMIVYGLPSAIRSGSLGRWLEIFMRTKDVVFRLSDPLPFFHLWIVLFQFIHMSRRSGLTLQQASTQDIEWDGEEIGST
ncbi:MULTISPECIES: ATP-grasp domain-containing protein [Nostocales]|uniref:ATP-grasp domain-containing protein n=3 Tax=Nostocales TaxID=1161 RepID=A0A0C1R1Z0_9CYAN|nr:ATP-grasp domain-containing protein [Tolypothrix bouteillei]KAF3887518.1 ATP-grasp domain-containing protein [Tolypothrix bouteillei VB521301]